ncbi:MAG: hypothetical protein V4525_10990 [Pseudomonadota bacterium]
MPVEFKFSLDQKVKTTFGSIGIVSMLGFDSGGQHYYVKTEHNDAWLKECHLEAAE